MSDIPKARALLKQALKLLDRRPCHYRAKGTRAKMTPVLALKIRAWAATHKWTQQRIAEKFNVTNARVSETLRGKNK